MLSFLYGGLISGIAISLKKLNPKVKIIGVQATGAAPVFLSFKSGRPVRFPPSRHSQRE